jgi:hypothetical protein
MSVIYEYLKILEQKKKQNPPQPAAPVPVPQSNNVVAPRYLITGFILLFCLSILSFLTNIKVSGPKVMETKVVEKAPVPNTEHAPVLEYSLKGIIYNAASPSAIINGKLVEKNGKIDDWRIIEISPSEVKMENTNNESVLTLKLPSPSGQ